MLFRSGLRAFRQGRVIAQDRPGCTSLFVTPSFNFGQEFQRFLPDLTIDRPYLRPQYLLEQLADLAE